MRLQRLGEPDRPRQQAEADRARTRSRPIRGMSRSGTSCLPTLSQMTTIHFEAVPAVEARRRTPGLVVMKFGGTSVGDTDKLKRVAERLVAAREAGSKVVAVLSAMGKTTDELIRLAHEVSDHPHPREYDMLVSTGERISNALCAMAIHDLGHEAVSFTGSQAGIVTDGSHTKAKIVEVRAQRIHDRARGGQDRARRRLPGRLDVDARRDDARPRRLRHDRRRARGGARRRRLRDLHRRRRRLHRRPADRPAPRSSSTGHLRGDARDVRVRGEGDGAAVDRGRPQLRCEAPRSLDVRGRRRNLDRRGGRGSAREGDHLRRHPRHLGGEGVDHRRARTARASPRRSSATSRAPASTST